MRREFPSNSFSEFFFMDKSLMNHVVCFGVRCHVFDFGIVVEFGLCNDAFTLDLFVVRR